MKISFYLNDSGYKNIDLSKPNIGNPGVAGTQYSFAMILFNYSLRYNDEIYFFHTNKSNLYSFNVKCVVANNQIEALHKAKEMNCYYLVVFVDDINDQLLKACENSDVKLIGWAHNFTQYPFLEKINNYDSYYRTVYVGKQQYFKYVDDDSFGKAVLIENMYRVNHKDFLEKKEPIVCFTGAIRKSKGFHVLASIWKDILKKVPNAQLYVLGSGNLYNQNSKVQSKYGIADEKYEDLFMPYLLDENGQILKSVHFLGIVGLKDEIYSKVRVGVLNPTGISECLPITALEFESYNIPVLTCRKKGNVDAVKHKVSGLVSHTKFGLKRNIVKMLKNDYLYEKISKTSAKFVEERFDPCLICSRWHDLFYGNQIRVKHKWVYPFVNAKLFRFFNKGLRKVLRFIPSFAHWSLLLSNLKGKIR